jgi:streptogramin lyase
VSSDRLSAQDLPVLLHYLAANFGPDAKPRAVRQEVWPPMDREALAKAQYIEYRMPSVPGNGKRRSAAWSMNLAPNGDVYVADFGGGLLWQLDPTTGETKSCPTPGGESPHNMIVDGDGTIWAGMLGPPGRFGNGSALAHMDPKTCLGDRYKFPETGAFGHTPGFTSKGDLWVTLLGMNAIGHWDRATDKMTYYLDPVPNAAPYGIEIDHHDRVWFAEYFGGAITRFDPATKTFKRFVLQNQPNNLRRMGADSRDNMWFISWGYMGKYGFLGRIDAKTGDMIEFTVPIEYGHPYDVRPDPEDNIWVAQDNYLAKFDQKTLSFTVYPVPERTDEIKLEVALDGAVWTTPRGAGGAGYGAAAFALYPDKDAIKTLRATSNPKLSNDFIAVYHGPFTKVTGVVKWQKTGAQNQVSYKDIPRGEPLGPTSDAPRGEPLGPTSAPE